VRFRGAVSTVNVPWDRMWRLIDCWLPLVRIYHAYRLRRMGVIT
jgi:hypothetical protein